MKMIDGHLDHTLGGNNYFKKSDAEHKGEIQGWMEFSESIILRLREKYEDGFNLLIWSEKISGYYQIPFGYVSHFFSESRKTSGKKGHRWDFSRRIDQNGRHYLHFGGRTSEFVEITEYFHNHDFSIIKPTADKEHVIDNELQDALVLVKQRRTQSTFRKKVLKKYDYKCCVSGIQEKELLEAGHIVPYFQVFEGGTSHKHDILNGLCLYTELHALFDLGYFAFDDDLKIIIKTEDSISAELKNRLDSIKSKTAAVKKNDKILRYIRWHRENVFRG
jgi:putative restriction endonuclease